MFGLFKSNKEKEIAKLQKQYAAIMETARDIQRSGDLRAYSAKIEESEILMAKIDALIKS
jgi:hypothetical protein